ncbi:MAG: hypothetical protein JEZ11_24665 [Desulfobacterales bacterium]|nr:hypothetical protein [Desulfobacterales bacterium]
MNSLDTGRIYCEKLETVVVPDEGFMMDHCNSCLMFAGNFQGEGIECFYDDPDVKPGEIAIVPDDPYTFMKKRHKAKANAARGKIIIKAGK